LVEGVLVSKKDFNALKHEELNVPNLEVIQAELYLEGLRQDPVLLAVAFYVMRLRVVPSSRPVALSATPPVLANPTRSDPTCKGAYSPGLPWSDGIVDV
jgi:hypothetical protein